MCLVTDVADIGGHAASQLDPHVEPQDGRARKSGLFSFFESFHVTDTVSARYLVSFRYLELYVCPFFPFHVLPLT